MLTKNKNILNDINKIIIPKHLYKYRELNNNTIEMLEEDYLWCSPAESYNDPFECYFNIDFFEMFKDYIIDEVEKYTTEDNLNHIRKINKRKDLEAFIKKELHMLNANRISEAINIHKTYLDKKIAEIRTLLRNNYKICCLSEDYLNRLMWAHYAKDHSGICIEYDSRSLLENVYKVSYIEKPLDITRIKEQVEEFSTLYAMLIMSSKDYIWSYEKEWRLILDKPENKFSIKPSAIYLGAKVSEDRKKEIKNIAKRKNIDLYNLKMNKTKYELIESKIKL